MKVSHLLTATTLIIATQAQLASAADGTVNFNGLINTTTCDTQNVNVYLGLHQTSEFTGVGSTSKAVVSSLDLLNCPSPETITEIDYRIDPTSAPIDAANSILSINPTTGAIAAASGVGVKVIGVATASGPFKIGVLQKSVGNVFTPGGPVSIPFVARYIQTASAVTPGPANATATFSIDYK